MSPTSAPTTKTLSGTARGLLNDLVELDRKVTLEMARGINESYLDRDGAISLAAKLGVEPPKVKRAFYRYFTRTQVYSVRIDAYTPEEADAEAQRLQNINAGQGDIHFGDRSSFNRENGRVRAVFSEVTRTRPSTDDMANLHPFEVERTEADARGESISFRDRMSWDSIIGR